MKEWLFRPQTERCQCLQQLFAAKRLQQLFADSNYVILWKLLLLQCDCCCIQDFAKTTRILPDSYYDASPGRAPPIPRKGKFSTTHVSPRVHILRRQHSLSNCANSELTFVSLLLDNAWLPLPPPWPMIDKWPAMQVQILCYTASKLLMMDLSARATVADCSILNTAFLLDIDDRHNAWQISHFHNREV